MWLGACASAPPAAPVVPPAPRTAIPWIDKIAWMVRLEDQRLIRDPNPPAPAALGPPATAGSAAAALPPPSDLLVLLDDRERAVRARAALALGRVGLPEAIVPLSLRLSDPDVDVRQTAAFALGLIGAPAARPVLLKALGDPAPIVQGRAAEALARIGDRADASSIAAMVQAHVKAGALASIDPDDLTYPLPAPAEAVRLGVYALTRLGSYESLASVVLDEAGQPVSRWWPIAYALQRVNDPRAVPALAALLETPGRFTAAFAAKGLGMAPTERTRAALGRIVEERRGHPMVVVQAMRTLAASGDAASVPGLVKMLGDSSIAPMLRLEAMSAFASLAGAPHVDLLLDLLSHPLPAIRGGAMRALARIDAEAFLSALATLDADAVWTVRVAQAEALGMLSGARGGARLQSMLSDSDARVIPAVLGALVASNTPGADRIAAERLGAGDFVVRAAAATALADLKAAGQVPALVAAYRAALDENTYVARAAMLSALHRLDRQAARPLLEGALKDRDWAVRVRASALLKEQGVTGPLADAMRPATAGRPIDDPEWRQIVMSPYAPHAFVETSRGTIELELAVVDAPLTTHNFITLARKGFFDGAPVHRVVPDFVMQDGDPRGDGEGGPGYTIRDELNELPYLRGTLGMALDWADTGGSQFFITHSPQPHLDARYTAFGRVVSGMEVVDQIVPADVIRRVRIWDGVNER